jgi:hypothetical protein
MQNKIGLLLVNNGDQICSRADLGFSKCFQYRVPNTDITATITPAAIKPSGQ